MSTALFACLFLLALSSPSAQRSPPLPTPAASTELTEGILAGLAADASLRDIRNCIEDIDEIGEAVAIAIKDISQNTPESLLAALKEVAAALQLVVEAFGQCSITFTPDEIRLSNAVKVLQRPQRFDAGALTVNSIDISRELKNLLKSWEGGEYKMAGFYLGAIAGKVNRHVK